MNRTTLPTIYTTLPVLRLNRSLLPFFTHDFTAKITATLLLSSNLAVKTLLQHYCPRLPLSSNTFTAQLLPGH